MVAEKISKGSMIKRSVLAIVLLVMGFVAPILGEVVRVETIGEEHVCCMPYDTPEERDRFYQKQAQAREKRGLADFYMIGGMTLGLVSVVIAGVLFYSGLKRVEMKGWLKIVLEVIFGLVLAAALFWTIGGLVVFLRDIEGYYALGGWGHIYYI